MNDVHDIHKLTGAYATDALDDLERARFEQHLAACPDCRGEVAELREAAARLAEVTATAAPDSLRRSVLTGISQVRPLPPRAPQVETRPTNNTPERRWFPFLVAAAVALLVGIGAAVTQPWADNDSRRLSAAEQVLQAPDAQKVSVEIGETGEATVVRSKSKDRAVIITEDMAPAPEGRVYQLWFQDPDDGSMIPAGLMEQGEDQTVVLEGSAAEATAVGITVEPAGGSEEPSTAPIVVFDLTEST